MEFLSTIVDFLFNKDRSITGKIGFVALVCLVPIGFELGTGFFSIWLNSQRIDQVEKIQTVLESKHISPDTRAYLKSIESDLVQHGLFKIYSVQDLRSDFILLIQNTMYSVKSKMPKESKNTANKELIVSKRQVYLHTFSSAWVLFIIMIFMPFSAFVGSMKGTAIAGVVVGEIMLALGVVCFAYAFSFIPIFGDGTVNLFINAVLHVVVLYVIARISNKFNKVDAENA